MKNELKKLRKWPKSDLPVEKLRALGPQALSNTELLALLLHTGRSNNDRIEMARDLMLTSDCRLRNLTKCSLLELMQNHKMNLASAASVIAFGEMSRRRVSEHVPFLPLITCSDEAVQFMLPILEDYDHEVFGVLLLNTAYYFIDFAILFEGGIDGTVVDPRVIFKYALLHKASHIMVCHNHPSGSTRPSDADDLLTEKLNKGGKFLDIKLMDHVIIADGSFYSFREAGKIL